MDDTDAGTHDRAALFEALYSTDLVYQADCWKLCGDAHCCSFKRYKSRFRIVGRGDTQDLPLLPGEFDFLEAKGWHRQFQDFIRHQQPYDFGPATVVLDTVSSHRPGCRCDHDTRTVICRLYPLLPVFDVDGRLVGTEAMGVFEELEQIEGLAPACQISALPFAQINLFLRICELLASDPVVLFHLAAYRAAKRHVFRRLADAKAKTGKSAFALYEAAFLRSRLIDQAVLKAELAEVYGKFEARYGNPFVAPMATLRTLRETA